MSAANLERACRDLVWNDAPVLALVFDPSGRVVEANAHAQAVLGAAVVGRLACELTVDHEETFSPGALARDGSRPLAHFTSPEGTLGTYRVHCHDLGESTLLFGTSDLGEQLFLQREMVALNDELGNLTRELSRKNAELARLNELKSRFLGMAAHDLRKPVGAMLTYSEFLIDEAAQRLDEEQRRFLGIIHSSCDFMRRLIDDFLDVAVIESGRLPIHLAPAEPAAIVAASLAVAEVLARRKGVSFDVDAPAGRAVRVDASKMEQVLNNLVTNAVEHSRPETTIAITSSVAGDHWHLAVRDRGTGIDARDLERLFSPFERGRVAKTAGEKSTGLGLAIARKIVEGHGGTLTAQSILDEGTTFTVRIPLIP